MVVAELALEPVEVPRSRRCGRTGGPAARTGGCSPASARRSTRSERGRRTCASDLAGLPGELLVLVGGERLLGDHRAAVRRRSCRARCRPARGGSARPASRGPRAARTWRGPRSRPAAHPEQATHAWHATARSGTFRARDDRMSTSGACGQSARSPGAPRPSSARRITCAGPGCWAASRRRRRSRRCGRSTALGQLGAALTVAAIRHGDRVGPDRRARAADLRRARRPRRRAGLRAAGARGRRGRLRRDPVPQPPRLPRRHVRGGQGGRPGAAA